MDFLRKMKRFGSNLVGQKCEPETGGILRENEMGNLGVTRIYSRVASSVGWSSHTSPISKKGLEDVVYIAYFILGTGYLLPWNAFITAVDYFAYLYPDNHVDRVFSIAYIIPCLVILVLLIAYGQKLGPRTRINCGLGLFIISIMVVPITEGFLINGQQGSSWTYIVTVSAVVVAATGDAFVSGTLIGFSGLLPERYTRAILAGTGISGVLVSFLRIVTKDSFPNTPAGLRSSANTFFSVSAVFLVVCVVAYNAVHNIAVKMVRTDQKSEEETEAEVQVLTSESDLYPIEEDGIRDCNSQGYDSPAAETVAGSSSRVVAVDEGKVVVPQRSRLMQIFVQVKWLAIGMTMTYVITLAIFPGFLTEDVTSVVFGDWYPVLLIGCYNVFDLVGKSLPPKYIPVGQLSAFGWAAGRLLFFPMFSACVHGPEIFRTEIPVFILTGLLGITNGYVTTFLFLMAPKSLNRGSVDAETSGVVMVLALQVGLTLGSLLSWVWVV